MKKKKKQDREIRINIRVPEAEKHDLKEVSGQTGITETLIVRHAVKKTLAEMRRQVEAGEGVTVVI